MKKQTKEPDKRTRQMYNDLGYHVIKVEAFIYIPGAEQQHRRDFLGIYDYIAMNDREIIAIQTTTKPNALARRKKMLKAKAFSWWTQGGRRSILHGWYKNKSNRWVVQKEELTMKDWHEYQAKIKKEMDSVDYKESALYKELSEIHGEF